MLFVPVTAIDASLGNVFRKVHSGQLQAYAFAFGLGVVLVVYFTVFS